MTSPSEDLALEIAKIKDNIREKYSALKNTSYETQRKFAAQYKPLIKPLKRLFTKIKVEPKLEPLEPQDEEHYEPVDEEHYEPVDEEHYEPVDEEHYEPLEHSEPRELTQDVEEVEDDTTDNDDGDDDDDSEVPLPLTNIDELLAGYLKFILNDTRNEADFSYGIVYDGFWKMGKLPVRFINNDILIGDKRYKGTPGLFELIFRKYPSSIFTEDDLKTYKSMLRQTGAHKGKDGKIKSSKGYKYTNIISNMFPPRRTLKNQFTPIMSRAKRALSKEYLASEEKRKKLGEGIMMRLTKDEIDYRYWDDPNELCYRLRLLVASKEAGNTGHDSEIVSILEELKEAKIIKDFDNVRL
jgi:hypothetical protein